MMLFKLLSSMDKKRFRCNVISLSDYWPIGAMIEKLDVPVKALNFGQSITCFRNLCSVQAIMLKQPTDIIQTWMYHADFVGSLIKSAHFKKKPFLIWNIRHSDFKKRKESLRSQIIVKACSILSHYIPTKIICNSFRGATVHKEMGYDYKKIKVIHNGFDTNIFKPDPAAYFKLRQSLHLPPDCLVVGKVARFHYQKNHLGFFEAAKKMKQQLPSIHFVLCGNQIEKNNKEIVGMIDKHGLTSCTHLLGLQSDMAFIYAGLDLAVSNSTVGEGLPNVIGEAMACGVPCVVTDVGDSKFLVGNTGKSVPPGKPQVLADACVDLLKLDKARRQSIGQMARQRICEQFSIKKIAKEYEQLYLSIMDSSKRL